MPVAAPKGRPTAGANGAGRHRGLDLDVPLPGPALAVSDAGGGRIERLDVLGGIIHEYYHRAA